MTDFSRRALLKGIASLPIVCAGERLTGASPWIELGEQPKQSITQLNILFHGLFAIFDTGHSFDVMAVDVVDHVFRAGNLDQEKDLAATEYELRGVKGQKRPDLVEAHNPVVHRNLKPHPQHARCTLKLPYPNQVFPLRRIRKIDGEDFFTGADAPRGLKQLPLVLAFVYTNFKSGEQPRLDSLGWIPEVRGGVANLHLRAEPPDTPPEDHLRKAFPKLVMLLGSRDLHLNPRYEDAIVEPKPPFPPIPGVTCADLMNLIERRKAKTCEKAKTMPGILSRPINCTSLFVVSA